MLIERARKGGDTPRDMFIEEIDGFPPSAHPMAPFLIEAGFRQEHSEVRLKPDTTY